MRYFTFFVFFVLNVFLLKGQDTLTIVQYNLLNYGNYTSYCTTGNNNINDKDNYLKEIINYLQPDIFSVNEISKSEAIHQHLLDMVLNTGGVNYYRKADFLSVANSYLVNMLYYNGNKLVLHSHYIAQSYVRDVDVYKLYYRSNDLPQGDTAFVICVVAHLKAGSDDEVKREVMAENTMDYLNDLNDVDNYLMMGDFNVYTSTEPAYQQFINYSNPDLRFNDPLNKPGNWNNNYTYRYVHTQSTHATSNGCASSGGMDDRFDFILISNSIKYGTKEVQYVNNSYWAVGQDGRHFNSSINASPTNNSVPSNVLNALANNSDHLPVTLKLMLNKTLDIYEINGLFEDIILVSPAGNKLDLKLWSEEQSALEIHIYNVLGELMMSEKTFLNRGENHIVHSIEFLNPGMYILRLSDKNSNVYVRKLLKR